MKTGRNGILLLALALTTPMAGGQDKPAHKGVATCASSVCHGSARDKPDSPLLRNEYLTWQRHDEHSKAYQHLKSEASRRIARRLDIGPAHEADICLDCHTDPVPPEQRGEQFLLSDGVGCETCHGGAEHWLDNHAGEDVAHSDNLDNGMVALEKARVRADVCQDCHIGDERRFAGHDLLGAGHPRLQFELMSYSVLQPAHYQTDEDYYERKPAADSPARIWAVGQVEAARRLLDGIQSGDFMTSPLWPELAYFDCHGCHTPMSVKQPEDRHTSPELTPGSPRLNDSALIMTLVLERVIDGGDADAMLERIRELHRASREGPARVRATAAKLDEQLASLSTRLDQARLTPSIQRRLLEELATAGAQGRFSGYQPAEQAAMATQVLLKRGNTAIQGNPEPHLKPVFDALDTPARPDDDAFEQAMKDLRDWVDNRR